MSIGQAVDTEQERLAALVALVWETHYSRDCGCKGCQTTREFVDPDDLAFVDHVSFHVKNNEPVTE